MSSTMTFRNNGNVDISDSDSFTYNSLSDSDNGDFNNASDASDSALSNDIYNLPCTCY